MRLKWIGRFDDGAGMLRLCRVMWERGVVGDGDGYSAKLSLGFRPAIIDWHFDGYRGWMVNLFGFRVHYQRAYGGIQT